MKSKIVLAALVFATPAAAETWATGNCTTQHGTKISYIVHDGEGFIAYNGGEPSAMYTKREGNMGIIYHVAAYGQMTMAINFDTGKGYIVTQRDSGKKIEGWVTCKLSTVNR